MKLLDKLIDRFISWIEISEPKTEKPKDEVKIKSSYYPETYKHLKK